MEFLSIEAHGAVYSSSPLAKQEVLSQNQSPKPSILKFTKQQPHFPL